MRCFSGNDISQQPCNILCVCCSFIFDEVCIFCKTNCLVSLFPCSFFLFIVDYERLLNQGHRIDGHLLVVELQEPEEEMPLDPRKLYVEELNPKTSNDCLKFYLEKFSGVDVEDIQFGCNNNALVTFESELGNTRSYK